MGKNSVSESEITRQQAQPGAHVETPGAAGSPLPPPPGLGPLQGALGRESVRGGGFPVGAFVFPATRLRAGQKNPFNWTPFLTGSPTHPSDSYLRQSEVKDRRTSAWFLCLNHLFFFFFPSLCFYNSQELDCHFSSFLTQGKNVFSPSHLGFSPSPSHLAVSILPGVSAIWNSLALSQLYYQNQRGSRLFYPHSMQEMKQSRACSQFDRLQV